MPSEITAERLNEVVSQWPEEARPKFLYFKDRRWRLSDHDYHDDTLTLVELAIAIHEAAAIRWLLRNDHNIKISKMTSGRHAVVSPDGKVYSAPTPIEALHAAIMATAKEGA